MSLLNLGIAIQGNSVASLASQGTNRMAFAMTKGVGDSLALIQQDHKLNQIKRGGKGKPDDKTWTSRKGTLRRSYTIDWSPGMTEGSYGSDLARALKVDQGGKIRSKRPGGYLTIPTSNAPDGARARDIPGLFARRSKSGKPYLAKSEGGQLRVMFLLRKEVTLPPRPALQRAVDATEGDRSAMFLRAVDFSIGGR